MLNMTRGRYESLIGEYRALCALLYRLEKENKENRAAHAICARMAELNNTLDWPAINRSYICRSLTSWDPLFFGHIGSRMKNHPTPNLKGI